MSDLRRLRYFLAVAETLNLTRAAERLHVAQPALGRQIRALERDLGVELLRRSPRSVELTDAGRALVAGGGELVQAFDELWAEMRRYGLGGGDELVLAHTPSTAYGVAPVLVEALQAAHPDLRVRSVLCRVDDALEWVRARRVTAALVRCLSDPGDVEVHLVRLVRHGLVLPARHRLAVQPAVAPFALAGERVLVHPRVDNPGHYDDVVALCGDEGAGAQVVERPLSFDPTHRAVRAGHGLAVHAEPTTPLAHPEVVWRPFDPPTYVEVQLAVPRPPRGSLVDAAVTVVRRVREERGWLARGDAPPSTVS